MKVSLVLVYEDETLLEAALCTEVVLCVLDTLETIIRVISMPSSDHLHFALPMVLRGVVSSAICHSFHSSFFSFYVLFLDLWPQLSAGPFPDAHVGVQSIRPSVRVHFRQSTDARQEVPRHDLRAGILLIMQGFPINSEDSDSGSRTVW